MAQLVRPLSPNSISPLHYPTLRLSTCLNNPIAESQQQRGRRKPLNPGLVKVSRDTNPAYNMGEDLDVGGGRALIIFLPPQV